MSKEIIRDLAQAFRRNEKEFYLVGGTVRDELLGRAPHDIDCATNALPDEIKQIVVSTNPTHIVPIGEKYGTIQAIYPASADPTVHCLIEITTFRGERYAAGSRKPEVEFSTSLYQDLSRRDFTINAIAKSPITGYYVDPFYGRKDIERRLIRVVESAAQPFQDDPLRLLRAIRLATQLNFHIHELTFVEIAYNAHQIVQISQERIRDELCKILLDNNCFEGIELLLETQLLHYILPEVEAMRHVEQPPHHKLDVYQHTMLVVQGVPARLEVRLAALLHDIAKPCTKTVESNGNAHFYEHEDVGSDMARDILRRLRFGNDVVEHVTKIIKLHMRINSYTSKWSIASVRRLFVDAGDVLDDLCDLAVADGASDRHETRAQVQARIDELRCRIAYVQVLAAQQPFVSPLSGNELMDLFNRPAGPWIKPLKTYLFNQVIEGNLSPADKSHARDLALAFQQTNML